MLIASCCLIAGIARGDGLPNYRLQELVGLPGSFSTQAFSISDSGIVSGFSNGDMSQDDYPLAVVWLDPDQTATYIGGLGLSGNIGSDVNSGGIVTGILDEGPAFAFVWDSNKGGDPVPLGSLGGFFSNPVAINDAGLIVGSSFGPDALPHAAMWIDAEPTALPETAGAIFSYAYDINEANQTAGAITLESGLEIAALWNDDELLELGTVSGYSTSAFGLNNVGDVVGYDVDTEPFFHFVAFHWRDGKFSVLDPTHGKTATSSQAFAVNDAGIIVGIHDSRAVAWRDGQMIDLEDQLIDGFEDWSLIFAYDINSSGWIVGVGSLAFENRAFLLIPLQTADLNQDGSVGVVDLLLLLAAWGPCQDCESCFAELDDDCNVGVSDLLLLLGQWG